MKKYKKYFLGLSSLLAATSFGIAASCETEKTDDSKNGSSVDVSGDKQKQPGSNDVQPSTPEEPNKTPEPSGQGSQDTTPISEKYKAQREELKTVVAAFKDEGTKLVLESKVDTAYTLEEIERVKKEIKIKLDELRQTYMEESNLNQLENQDKKAAYTKEFNDAKTETDLETTKNKVVEDVNQENTSKITGKKTQLNTELEKLTNKKDYAQRITDATEYQSLLEIEKAIKKDLLEEKTQKEEQQYETNFDLRWKVQEYIALLPEDQKTTKTSEYDALDKTTEKLQEFKTQVEGLLSKEDQTKLSAFKTRLQEILNEAFGVSKSSREEKWKEINTKLKSETETNDFPKLDAIFTTINHEYFEKVKSLNEGLRGNSLAWLNEVEPDNEYGFNERARAGVFSRKDYSALVADVREKLLPYKPKLRSEADYVKYFSKLPHASTLINDDNPLQDGEKEVRTVTLGARNSENKRYVKDSIPFTNRTFTLSAEDKKVLQNLQTLRNLVLKELMRETGTQVNNQKVFDYNTLVFGNKNALKNDISYLLWSIDKAIINGDYYQQVVDYFYNAKKDLRDLSGKTFSGYNEILQKIKQETTSSSREI
ncbi:hypothetical protein [Mycoplasma leonicaptivi]|uniref:hypothetical protein n=1 Tax=Mycoplasma leonicaptivi TaxID=36742 RepID=UPI000B2F5894|nr:hypothetical protein [Mycoplasma leonicaptivi]